MKMMPCSGFIFYITVAGCVFKNIMTKLCFHDGLMFSNGILNNGKLIFLENHYNLSNSLKNYCIDRSRLNYMATKGVKFTYNYIFFVL